MTISEIIRNIPGVQALIDKEIRKHQAALKKNAEILEEFRISAERLTTRMVMEGHWIRKDISQCPPMM